MRAVLQRVSSATVRVEGEVVGQIGSGVLALVAATHEDTEQDVATMARKIADVRILADDTSLSDHITQTSDDITQTSDDITQTSDHVTQTKDDVTQTKDAPAALIVSQFTLYGTTKKGRRPSWSAAAPGPVAEPMVDAVAAAVRARGIEVATGVFGAQMAVELVNDGPFTLIVDS
ncbi:D-aminoacyl-tRNA deacylase [soil metagenome]